MEKSDEKKPIAQSKELAKKAHAEDRLTANTMLENLISLVLSIKTLCMDETSHSSLHHLLQKMTHTLHQGTVSKLVSDVHGLKSQKAGLLITTLYSTDTPTSLDRVFKSCQAILSGISSAPLEEQIKTLLEIMTAVDQILEQLENANRDIVGRYNARPSILAQVPFLGSLMTGAAALLPEKISHMTEVDEGSLGKKVTEVREILFRTHSQFETTYPLSLRITLIRAHNSKTQHTRVLSPTDLLLEADPFKLLAQHAAPTLSATEHVKVMTDAEIRGTQANAADVTSDPESRSRAETSTASAAPRSTSAMADSGSDSDDEDECPTGHGPFLRSLAFHQARVTKRFSPTSSTPTSSPQEPGHSSSPLHTHHKHKRGALRKGTRRIRDEQTRTLFYAERQAEADARTNKGTTASHESTV